MKNRKASRCRLLRLLSVLGLLSAAFLLCLLGSCRNAASDSDTETRSDAATGTATEPTTAGMVPPCLRRNRAHVKSEAKRS